MDLCVREDRHTWVSEKAGEITCGETGKPEKRGNKERKKGNQLKRKKKRETGGQRQHKKWWINNEQVIGDPNTLHVCFAAKFTEFPRNVTATEGQNVEMSCAFQSGSASVYLEIQWWFLRAAEDQEAGAEVTGTQVLNLSRGVPKPPGNATGGGQIGREGRKERSGGVEEGGNRGRFWISPGT